MSNLPEVKNEKDYLESLKFSNGSTLTEKEIKKIIATKLIKNKEEIIEISGLFELIGIKETIKFLEENKGETFKNLIKKSSIFDEPRRKYFLELTAPLRSFSKITEGVVKCPKCSSRKVKIIQKQTRAGDEGTTEFASCICGFNWRI